MRSFMVSALHNECYLGGQRKKNKMSWACGMQGQGGRCIQGCGKKSWTKDITWKTYAQVGG